MSELVKVTQEDLARELAEALEVTIKEGKHIQETYWGIIEGHVAKREVVAIFNRIKLEPVERDERKGRNPQTGEEITIKAHTALKTTSFRKLKDLAKHGA